MWGLGQNHIGFPVESALLYHLFLCSMFFFFMWSIFQIFIEFVSILFLFYVLDLWPWGTGALSSPARDWTHTSSNRKWSLSHWTTMETWIFFSPHSNLLSSLPCSVNCLLLTREVRNKTILFQISKGWNFRVKVNTSCICHHYLAMKLTEVLL